MKKKENVTKKVAAVFFCGIMLAGVAACGAKASESTSYQSINTSAGGSAWADSAVVMESEAVMKEELKAVADSSTGETGALVSTSQRKVIKTARLNLQTLEFDKFAMALEAKIAETGAYLQYADVSGSDYYGGRKSASYTIRVPEARLDEFLEGIEGIATVTNKTLGEEDVTLNYVDTESRIKTLQVEQERLLVLLEKAEDLDSIILLEQRLSEVRYQLESYQSKLRTYDDKITYSTVYVSVYEVTRVKEKEPETVLERIRNGWNNTMYDITTGAQDLFVWVVVNIPYLVFWGLVLVAVVVFVRKKHGKKINRKFRKQSEKNETELDSEE